MLYGWIVRHHLKTASQQITESSREKVQTQSSVSDMSPRSTNVQNEETNQDPQDTSQANTEPANETS